MPCPSQRDPGEDSDFYDYSSKRTYLHSERAQHGNDINATVHDIGRGLGIVIPDSLFRRNERGLGHLVHESVNPQFNDMPEATVKGQREMGTAAAQDRSQDTYLNLRSDAFQFPKTPRFRRRRATSSAAVLFGDALSFVMWPS